MEVSLSRAAARAGRTPRVIVGMIQAGALPARWTLAGWQIDTRDLDAVLDRVARAATG